MPTRKIALAKLNGVHKFTEDFEKTNGGSWAEKAEIKTKIKFLAAGETCMVIF